MKRIPEGESWRDHAELCENCKKPVLRTQEHRVGATLIEPDWWTCDFVEELPPPKPKPKGA